MKKPLLSIHLLIVILLLFLTKTSEGQCSEFDIINLKKIAIVFGEKDYKYAGALTNPLNDAQDISDSLKKMGFTVYTYYNTDFKTMTVALDDWYSKLSKYEVSLFYYSGHGAEVNGENYLFPIDANPKGPSDLYYMAYSASRVLSSMESNNTKFNIMILDACRSNPFTKSWSRDFKGGLASMTGKGSFIGFAASPGTTASDGDRRNGTYTEAILNNISVPNYTIDQIFTKVNSYVRTKTSETQVPYKNSSLSSDFCFSVRTQKLNQIQTKSSFIQPASGILLSPIEEKLFIADSMTGGINIQDSRTLIIQKRIIENSHPFLITTRNGENIYVIDTVSKALAIFDLKNAVVKANISLRFAPTSVVISPDERKAYVSSTPQSNVGITVVDLLLNKITKQIPIIGTPEDLVMSTDGRYLFSSNYIEIGKGSLCIIDVKTDKVVRYIEGIANGKSIGVLPNNKKIYASSVDETNQSIINVVDLSSSRVLKSISFEALRLTFTPDGKYLFALGKREVLIINTSDDIVLNRLPFATQPKGIALSNDGRAFVWLPSEQRTIVLPIYESLKQEALNDPELLLEKFIADSKRQAATDTRFKLEPLFSQANSAIYAVIEQLMKELGAHYNSIQTGIEYNYKTSTYSNQLGINSKFDKTKSIWPIYKATFSETLLVVTLSENNSEETFKQPINNIDWAKVKQFIRTFYIKRIEQLR